MTADQYVAAVNTRALALLGLMPGDEILFDMGTQAVAGDVVQAQIYGGTGAETVLRIYDPPYLVARSLDASAPKPVAVDGERVRIAAVALRLHRSLRGS